MMDNILKTDQVQEYITNRQSAKINYLQQEIAQLQDTVKDLSIVYKLNKEALKIACSQDKSPGQSNKFNDIFSERGQSTTLSSVQNSLKKNQDNSEVMLQQLLQENEQLMQITERVKRERDTSNSKALINLQIAEQVKLHENEILQEYEEKITELRRIIQDKEYTIQEFEKSKPIIENGLLFKCKEIATPTEQVIKLHKEIEDEKNHIAMLIQQNQDLQAANEQLALKNFVFFNIIFLNYSRFQIKALKKELFKIKLALANQVNFWRMKSYAINNEDDISFDENSIFLRDYYDLKKIADEQNEDEEDENQNQQYDEMNKQQLQIPSIDIHKAQQVQQKILDIKFGKNTTNVVNNNEEMKNLFEKYQKMEQEMQKYKKLWEREAFGNKLLLQNLKVIDSFANKTVETNENLVNSNKLLSERAVKILAIADYFYEFYSKYMTLITQKSLFKRRLSLKESNQENFKKIDSNTNNKQINVQVSVLEEENNSMFKKVKTKQQQKESELEEKFEEQLTPNFEERPEQKQLIEEFKQLKEEVILTDQQFQGGDEEDKNQFDEFDLEECKIFLMNMARDLYCENQVFNDIITKDMLKNIRTNQNPQNKFKTYFQVRRTLSNGLEYVSSTMTKKIDSQINQEKSKKKRFVRDYLKEQQNDKSAIMEEQKQHGFVKRRGFIPFQVDDISQILAAGYNPTEDDINKTQRMEDLQLLEFK